MSRFASNSSFDEFSSDFDLTTSKSERKPLCINEKSPDTSRFVSNSNFRELSGEFGLVTSKSEEETFSTNEEECSDKRDEDVKKTKWKKFRRAVAKAIGRKAREDEEELIKKPAVPKVALPLRTLGTACGAKLTYFPLPLRWVPIRSLFEQKNGPPERPPHKTFSSEGNIAQFYNKMDSRAFFKSV